MGPHLVRPVEALHVVDRRAERGRGHRPNPRSRPQLNRLLNQLPEGTLPDVNRGLNDLPSPLAVALPVPRRELTIDPTEAERFVQRVGVGEARDAAALLVEDEPDARRTLMYARQPAAPCRGVVHHELLQ